MRENEFKSTLQLFSHMHSLPAFGDCAEKGEPNRTATTAQILHKLFKTYALRSNT